MIKKNKKLSKNDTLTEKLQSLKKDNLVDVHNVNGNDVNYTITKKGNDLIWK
ncbi:MAG: hypothetical protein ACRBB5_02525 [Nitrosopumilus sp.]